MEENKRRIVDFSGDYAPFNWQEINVAAGTYTPSSGPKYFQSQVYNFWCRSFFQRAMSTLIIETPKEWQGGVKDFLYWCLARRGYVYVGNSDIYKYIFQPCTVNGYDIYYQPSEVTIANPYMESIGGVDRCVKGSKQGIIKLGKEGNLLKLTPDGMGIYDIVRYYAEKMAIMDPAINVAIINSKLAWVLAAKSKSVAETMKKILDLINAGEPAVVFNEKYILPDDEKGKEPYQFIDRKSIGNDYIVDKLLQDWQTIINDFDAEVGIPTVPYAKKERMVVSEAESRQVDSTSRSIIWKECLESSLKEIHKVCNVPLKIKLRYDPEEMTEKSPEEAEASSPERRDD